MVQGKKLAGQKCNNIKGGDEMDQPTNGISTKRDALGKHYGDIWEDLHGKNAPQTESVFTARAAFEIAAILENVEDRQVINVFRFVQSIRQTAKGETVSEIGEGLNRLDRERRANAEPKKSRWWWSRKE